jgi:hypothetical protein
LNISLDDIEVADINVASTTIDLVKRIVIIDFPESYYAHEKKWLSNTKIIITGWDNFTCIKNIYEESTGNTTTTITKKYDEIERFELVQEIITKENDLTLSGWSKKPSCWMSYEFINPKVNIDAK